MANRQRDDADDVDDEGGEDDNVKCLGRSGGGEEKGEAIYDLVPSLKGEPMSDEPNNQKPRPEGQTKRKVRFKNNI